MMGEEGAPIIAGAHSYLTATIAAAAEAAIRGAATTARIAG